MKNLIKLEEAVMAALGIYLLTCFNPGIPGWIWFFIFFLPDIGMLGYLVNAKTGAVMYNIFHHKGLAIIIAMTGYFLKNDIVTVAGILLFAHSSFDRVMGYGLKYYSDFKDTHLGRLNERNQ